MAGWLSGFFDGEGSAKFTTHVAGKRHACYHLSVSNTDPALMTRCINFLDRLGIGHTEWFYRGRTDNRKPFATLHICKIQDIRMFAQLVGFGAPAKQATLLKILEWGDRARKWEHRLPEISQMHEAGWSLRKLCKWLGLRPGGHALMARRMRAAGLPVHGKRPRHQVD